VVDLSLTDEQVALRDSVAQFARNEVAPVIGGLYERHEFPYDLVRGMGRMGLFGLPFPEDVGGMGGDLFGLGIALEELARVDSSVAITLEAAVCLGAMPIHRFGSASQRDRWLPLLTSAQALGAFGLTEPGGGTDTASPRTRARRDGSGWVVDGSKAFITNSGTDLTAFVVVTAETGRRPDGRPEISALLVPTGTPGLTVGPAYSKVGWSSSDTHEVSLDGVRLGADALVGDQGRGHAQFLAILDEGRVALAALATGLAQGCVDESVAYANQREAFGRAIGAHQALAFQIADMEAAVHVARLAWYDAASRAVSGLPFSRQAAIAKLVASEAAVANARTAAQVFGGYGFMNDYPVGRFYRDAKILEIGEGTSEVQRMIIARSLGLPRDR
jgi:butyryl-CoA dehydrogenase